MAELRGMIAEVMFMLTGGIDDLAKVVYNIDQESERPLEDYMPVEPHPTGEVN